MQISKFLKKVLPILSLSLCLSAVKTVPIHALPEGRYEVRIVKKPTEHENGIREYLYEDGFVYSEVIPATGHVWSEWIIDQEPTATEAGRKYRICTKYPDAPHYEEAIIPPLGQEESESSAESHFIPGRLVQIKPAKDQAFIAQERTSEAQIVPETSRGRMNLTETDKDMPTEPQAVKESEGSVLAAVEQKVQEPSIEREEKRTVMRSREESSSFFGKPNAVDAVCGAAFVGIMIWGYVFVWPLLAALHWARKRRRELMEK